jgi:LacI family transcriptional regulator
VSVGAVAEAAGVSVATVSRIVNGITNKASPQTVTRVRAVVAELGYRPMSVGRALRQGKSRLVAVLAANIANPAMAAIAAATESALRSEGLTMVLCDTHDQSELQDEYLLEMRAQLARAIVFLGVIRSPELAGFRKSGMPLIFVSRRPPGRKGPYIGIDNRAAGRDVAEHFLGRGIAGVAVVHGNLTSSATAERVAAFRQTMAQAGRPVRDDLVLTAPSADHLAIGADVMRRLLDSGQPPRGLFCLSDLIAFGAHRIAQEAGIAVPDDMLIVGFDDNPLNQWIAPWLSSVSVPYGEFGDAVVDVLKAIERGEASPSAILPHHLVERPLANR